MLVSGQSPPLPPFGCFLGGGCLAFWKPPFSRETRVPSKIGALYRSVTGSKSIPFSCPKVLSLPVVIHLRFPSAIYFLFSFQRKSFGDGRLQAGVLPFPQVTPFLRDNFSASLFPPSQFPFFPFSYMIFPLFWAKWFKSQ